MSNLHQLDALNKRMANVPRKHHTSKLLTGRTPSFASALDPRFSFSTYVPACHTFDGPPLPLVVFIHGTSRLIPLSAMTQFAEDHNCIVLAPLFPCGIIELTDMHSYKSLLFHDIRFDLVLLSMIEQASHIWRIRTDKFLMHGFSGGGQFCHRFLYLHPSRLAGISIGAPGAVTLPLLGHTWPRGISNIKEHFGVAQEASEVPDFTLMGKVPIQFITGEKDTQPVPVAKPGDGTERGDEAKESRMDKIILLKDAWRDLGVTSVVDVVPGLGHEGTKILPFALRFLGPLVGGLQEPSLGE